MASSASNHYVRYFCYDRYCDCRTLVEGTTHRQHDVDSSTDALMSIYLVEASKFRIEVQCGALICRCRASTCRCRCTHVFMWHCVHGSSHLRMNNWLCAASSCKLCHFVSPSSYFTSHSLHILSTKVPRNHGMPLVPVQRMATCVPMQHTECASAVLPFPPVDVGAAVSFWLLAFPLLVEDEGVRWVALSLWRFGVDASASCLQSACLIFFGLGCLALPPFWRFCVRARIAPGADST